MRVGILGASLWILAQTLACAKDVVLQGGRYVDRRLLFSVEDPTRGLDGWERVHVEGTLLAFRGPQGATMSLLRQCSRPAASLPILARQLLRGTDSPVIRQQGLVAVAGGEAFVVVARAGLEGRAADVKTVTRRLRDCTLDFVLVAPSGFEEAEVAFDRWWTSLRGPAADAAPEPGAGP
jgi:hypothetical protein